LLLFSSAEQDGRSSGSERFGIQGCALFLASGPHISSEDVAVQEAASSA
jgi:hypothetical protein